MLEKVAVRALQNKTGAFIFRNSCSKNKKFAVSAWKFRKKEGPITLAALWVPWTLKKGRCPITFTDPIGFRGRFTRIGKLGLSRRGTPVNGLTLIGVHQIPDIMHDALELHLSTLGFSQKGRSSSSTVTTSGSSAGAGASAALAGLAVSTSIWTSLPNSRMVCGEPLLPM